jgi:ubiquitin-conjugating enzyme (huntingtin interacting protein 2)
MFLQYLRDYPTFAATARYWTEAFAKSASTGMEEKVWRALFIIPL